MKIAPPPPNEESRLKELREAEILDTSPEQAFDELARLASYICGVPIALVSLVDEKRQWFKSKVGLDASETPRDVAFCAHAILEDQVFVVPDARRDERFRDNPLVTGAPEVRFYAGAPLLSRKGHALGTLCVIDQSARKLNDGQIEALRLLARQVVDQIELRSIVGRLAQANDRLRASENDLRLSESRQRALLDALPDAMFRVGADGTILDSRVGRRHKYFRGLRDITGRKVQDTFPEDLAEPFLRHVRKALETNRIEVFEHTRSSTGRRRDTECRIVSNGSEEVVTILRDITGRKEAERLKNEFISTVSHELRTPLTSIHGSLRLLEKGIAGTLGEEALKLVTIASNNSERLIRLINDILDLEKMSARKLELTMEELESRKLAQAALDGVRGMADGEDITLRLSVEEDGVVRADEGRILQVLTNLLSNAIKFSPAGATVELRLGRASDGWLRFAVVDRGPGIPAEHRERIFGRFQQVDASDSRRKGGTGLGLAICKSIVEQHGGAIGIDTSPGEGSTFWFELALSGTDQAPGPTAAGLPVLVVEDDEDLAEIVRRDLGREGYTALRASTIAEAERILHDHPVHAVLLDIGLPDGNGLELTARLREREETRTTPIIVISGRRPGDTGYLPPMVIDWFVKPFDPDRLLTTLRRAVRRPGRPRVLIVDDDASTRTVLASQLGPCGVECIEASDGREAVRLARSRMPDLIILDVGIPRLDGFEVVEILRRESSRATPLIVYTGRDLDAAERQRLTLGITRHLTKARVSEQEFSRTVLELLNDLVAETPAAVP